MLVGGEWVDSVSGQTFDAVNPATGEMLVLVAAATAEDVDNAVSAARQAFESGPWPKMSGTQRGELLWKIGDLIDQHATELAELETLDNGKPFNVALKVDVPQAARHFRYYAGWAARSKDRPSR
jgi:acyl-CoA reductase-like NAD-dependent aldehyde dehydrogenase